MTRRTKWAIRLLGVLVVGVIAVVALWWTVCTGVWARYPSPDRQYEVVVYSVARLFAMPGDGGAGTSSGYFVIRTAWGRILAVHPVDMVREMRTPIWSKQAVYIPLEGEWPLPQAIHSAPAPSL